MKTSIVKFLSVALGISLLSSCLPLAAGATAGYIAHKEGYRVQNPVHKR
ncbi:MAG: hypothetical protein QE267_05025 [Akkermansiaceae bacterium]|jgi:hypothetical protein|nr:hypothetical protein [Akkermansiaceae bacterium]